MVVALHAREWVAGEGVGCRGGGGLKNLLLCRLDWHNVVLNYYRLVGDNIRS